MLFWPCGVRSGNLIGREVNRVVRAKNKLETAKNTVARVSGGDDWEKAN